MGFFVKVSIVSLAMQLPIKCIALDTCNEKFLPFRNL